MRQRISWLVLLTTSAVVVSFVVPLCLLVRTLAEDRAMAAVDQQAGNVAALVAGQVDEQTLTDVVDDLNAEGSTQVTVFTADGGVVGAAGAGRRRRRGAARPGRRGDHHRRRRGRPGAAADRHRRGHDRGARERVARGPARGGARGVGRHHRARRPADGSRPP